MSTVITGGFRLERGTDPFTFAAQARERLTTRAAHRAERNLITRATLLADDAYTQLYGKPALDEVPLAAAWLAEDEDARNARREGRLGACDVTVWLGRDPQTWYYYGITQTPDPDLEGWITNVPGWVNFEYWNDADRPDSVSDAEWKERREVWDRVLPGVGRPLDSMLSLEIRTDVPTTVNWEAFEANRMLFGGTPALATPKRALDRAHRLVCFDAGNELAERDDIIRLYTYLGSHGDLLADTASILETALPDVGEDYLTHPVENQQIPGLAKAVRAAAQATLDAMDAL